MAFGEKLRTLRGQSDLSQEKLAEKLGVTEAAAKEAVAIFVQIPSPRAGKVELEANAKTVEIHAEAALNQISAASKICIPEGTAFAAVTKGIGTSISFEKNGKQAETFDDLEAVLIVMTNRGMFFETEHIGNLLNYNETRSVNE